MTVVPQAAAGGVWPRALSPARLRLWSGLILFSFALLHLLNLIAGFWSFEAMQAGQAWRTAVTRSAPGTAVLVLAALVHAGLGMGSLIRARTWRIGARGIVQLAFGVMIPVFLIRHVWDTRGAHEMFGIADSYAYALWGIWPNEAWNQALLVAVVWVHGCIGLHRWLAARAWYQRALWLWYGLAVLIPVLAYAGFVTAARAWKATGQYRNPFKPGEWEVLTSAIARWEAGYWVLLGAVAAVWLGLIWADRLGHRIGVTYQGGARVMAPRGLSLLDISRINRIPHASVCGGRARCSTCRVRVIEGTANLSVPGETEIAVLRRVGAPANVRLACQARPAGDVTITTLLPAVTGAGLAMDRYHWGVEADVTILFCDLRGFTKMSEGKLPFDVVFLLNQFLGRMAEAIEDCGGFVDKFMGDGVMAIFGMEAEPSRGAVQALAAARAMGGVLEALNQSLREDLERPLSMGIGIHCGPAILGRIGAAPGGAAVAQITALGETVNIASRLEGLTKDLGVQVILSAETLALAGLRPEGMAAHSLTVRGRSLPIDVFAATRAAQVPAGDAVAEPVA
ncbi:MAG: adenylate/guanylate cyclase domain-containing protein [Gemmobacter sp.]